MKMHFQITEAQREDLPALLLLYKELHENDPVPQGAGAEDGVGENHGEPGLSYSDR